MGTETGYFGKLISAEEVGKMILDMEREYCIPAEQLIEAARTVAEWMFETGRDDLREALDMNPAVKDDYIPENEDWVDN